MNFTEQELFILNYLFDINNKHRWITYYPHIKDQHSVTCINLISKGYLKPVHNKENRACPTTNYFSLPLIQQKINNHLIKKIIE